tara:strand:+ start:1747 stop:2415 length:669 start_codon:yes stop_codon:yes gene_type:complete
MIEIVLDTETTGLSVEKGHRIVEIGCIELENQIPTKRFFHRIVNPKRSVSEDAYKIHGYSDSFLSTKKEFSEIANDFLEFIKGNKLIIHNAEFDLAFLNSELRIIKKEPILKERVIDTLELARLKFPGSSASLDALCKRFKIDNSKRKKHDAITDCELLSKVYINLIGQKEPTLKLNSDIQLDKTEESNNNKNYYKKIIYPSKDELSLHNKFLKDSLKRNNF